MAIVEAGPELQATFPVENPATGETIASVPNLDAAGVKALVDRARAAQPAWEALGFDGRAEVMYELRRWIVDNRDRVAKTLSEENGKPPDEALLTEIFYVADSLGFWAKKGPKYLADERVRTHSPLLLGKKVVTRYRPYGVVGVIGPWNYPLVNNFGDAIPALMAGNSVVLKPSSITPLSSMLMEKGLREVGVPGQVEIGAVTSPDQAEVVEEHLRDAVEKGAKVEVGGKRRDGPGCFFEP